MRPLRLAVVGVGSMGRHHVRVLMEMEDVTLVAAVDPDAEHARPRVEPYGVPLLRSIDELPTDLDAAVVAVPATSHCEVALPLLLGGVSLLVEKPLAACFRDAMVLKAAAVRGKVVLATGLIERFDPGFEAVVRAVTVPHRIECVRVAPWSPRVKDVGVIFDLMIHDLDLCLALTGSEVSSVTARGHSILSEHEDEVQAELTFANGCVAELRASRVAPVPERSLSVWSRDGEAVTVPFDRSGDKLTAELTDFLAAVRKDGHPRVTAGDGLRSVELAEQVLEALA